MPKVVDHWQRRGEMVQALWRIAAYEGLEAVSLNRVADEAGVSKGRVQHYFGSRDALLDYTAAYLTDRVTARIKPRLAAAPDAPAAVRGALLEVLPLTEDSIVDTRVGIAFLIRALGEDALRERYSARNEQFLELLTYYLTVARDEGAFDAGREPRAVAVELFALVNGLKEPLLLGDLTPDDATAIVDDALARLAP
ncbi:TetR/AcrR family transcriptional regulator [Actinomycetospora sp.]|uniref:TetR/AcrR family transcriptional regulator n=1 Tax=Actinomycetospora sp. TaxID=1872135 RepID=UPI002F3FB829